MANHILQIQPSDIEVYLASNYNNSDYLGGTHNLDIVLDFSSEDAGAKVIEMQEVSGYEVLGEDNDATAEYCRIYGNVIYEEEPKENMLISLFHDKDKNDKKIAYTYTNSNGYYEFILKGKSDGLYMVVAEDTSHKYNRQIKAYTVAEPYTKAATTAGMIVKFIPQISGYNFSN